MYAEITAFPGNRADLRWCDRVYHDNALVSLIDKESRLVDWPTYATQRVELWLDNSRFKILGMVSEAWGDMKRDQTVWRHTEYVCLAYLCMILMISASCNVLQQSE
jgi:hypothetical protein